MFLKEFTAAEMAQRRVRNRHSWKEPRSIHLLMKTGKSTYQKTLSRLIFSPERQSQLLRSYEATANAYENDLDGSKK